jgi:beta-lactamase class A
MLRAAAANQASQPGRRPGTTATASRPEPSRHGHGSPANPLVARPALGASDARAAPAVTLARLLRHHAGRLGVGVTDLSTGLTAAYHARQAFHTASIVKAAILAALLLQRRQKHAALSPDDQALAAAMIENNDSAAASALWAPSGEQPASPPPTRSLLRHTVPGQSGYWGLPPPRSPTSCVCCLP